MRTLVRLLRASTMYAVKQARMRVLSQWHENCAALSNFRSNSFAEAGPSSPHLAPTHLPLLALCLPDLGLLCQRGIWLRAVNRIRPASRDTLSTLEVTWAPDLGNAAPASSGRSARTRGRPAPTEAERLTRSPQGHSVSSVRARLRTRGCAAKLACQYLGWSGQLTNAVVWRHGELHARDERPTTSCLRAAVDGQFALGRHAAALGARDGQDDAPLSPTRRTSSRSPSRRTTASPCRARLRQDRESVEHARRVQVHDLRRGPHFCGVLCSFPRPPSRRRSSCPAAGTSS